MRGRARRAPPPADLEPRPAAQSAPAVVVYAAEDDPATADRIVALFRRLLARARSR